jgi:hypothetical protein
MTKSGGLALSEVKGGAKVDAAHAVTQIENALKKVAEKNLLGDLERVEIIMKKGEQFSDPIFGTKDGYLVYKKSGAPVTMEGFPLLFIKVVEI